MNRLIASGLIASMGIGGIALAKTPALSPTRGTISAVHEPTLAITEISGAKVSLTLAPTTKVTDVIPGSLSDLKAGSFIGTAAIKQPNGVYRAMELQIFPESMRGDGLGTRPWNLAPHSSMTNGTVSGLTQAGGTVGTVSGSSDLTLTVNDGSGTKTVLIPGGVPVVTFAPGTTAELRPGAHVIFFPRTAANGTLTANWISVGKNGLVPPM